MDQFALVLADLGTLIDTPLHPDHKRSCTLNVNNLLHVQLQEEENKDRMLIGTFLGELPPGKFREKILIETLKENHLFPRIGTLSYSPRNNQLAFSTFVLFNGLKGDILADILEIFLERALSWKIALETGQAPHQTKKSLA